MSPNFDDHQSSQKITNPFFWIGHRQLSQKITSTLVLCPSLKFTKNHNPWNAFVKSPYFVVITFIKSFNCFCRMKNLHKAQRTQKSQTSYTVLFGNKLNGASANAKGVNTIIKGVDAHINTIKVIMGVGGGWGWRWWFNFIKFLWCWSWKCSHVSTFGSYSSWIIESAITLLLLQNGCCFQCNSCHINSGLCLLHDCKFFHFGGLLVFFCCR